MEIERKMTEMGLTYRWLARRINVNAQSLNNWMRGLAEPRDGAVWDKMLTAIEGGSSLKAPQVPVGFRAVKLHDAGIVPAGDWGDPLASEDFIEVDAKYEHPRRFAATVSGLSCYPCLEPGDLTIWHCDQAPPLGTIVLAEQFPAHECTVKELTQDVATNQLALRAINPQTEPLTVPTGWEVRARLVAVIRKVDGVERSWYNPAGLRPKHLS